MLSIIGIVMTFVLLFGSYIQSGGKIEIILRALPHELPMIFGAGLGAYLLANKEDVIKNSIGKIKTCFTGAHWNKQDFTDILILLFLLLKTAKQKGIPALEAHIEKPAESTIFQQFPKITQDHFATPFICDTLRMITMSFEDPMQMEDMMQKQIDKHHHEAVSGCDAIQGFADGMPAIGIVAAVLGVIKTMASIDSPPVILGGMIGGALVGTFLGVFLAYCFFAPFASKSKSYLEQDGQFYLIIRDIIVSHLRNNAPQVSVEIGRGLIPTKFQPSFAELEEVLNNAKI